MNKRWLVFWGSCLLALLALGGWRAAIAHNRDEMRGIELPTRNLDMPQKLPLSGINVELTRYKDVDAELQAIADLGFVWLRQPFLWSEIEPVQGEFNWDAYDAIVEAVATYNGRVQLVALLDGSPRWARHEDAPDHPFAPPASPADYGVFARAVAERYGDRIDYYQIWDEPNIEEHWGNLNPRPALYVAMLDAAYQAIHEVDPNAMVIAAALAPNVEDGPDNINDPDYLRAIYELGGKDSFDAAAGKPYGFDDAPYNRTVELGHPNFNRLILLRDVMLEYGDGDKPLWGGNWGWNALSADWSGAPSIWGSVSYEQQTAYTHDALTRAQSEWGWVGGLILQHWQPAAPSDDPIQGFAVAPRSDNWKDVVPASDAMTTGLYPAVNPYAVYEGDWEFSDLGADAGADAEVNTITVTFEGTEFALKVRRGDYQAYLDVEIDGQPANALPQRSGTAFITLTSVKREPAIDLILVADNLAEGRHTAVISHRPDLGDDHYPIVGFAVATVPQTDHLPERVAGILFIIGIIGTVISGWRLPWGNIQLPSPASVRNMGEFLLGLFFSTILMGGTLLTFQDTLVAALRRDLPAILSMMATSTLLYYAPSTWIALIALVITGIIIFSRPWLGILLTLFWSAFFTSAIDPFFRAITIVDVLATLTLLASIARLTYDYAKERKEGKNGQSLFSLFLKMRLHPLDWCMIGLVGLGAVSLLWSDLLPEALRQLRIMLIAPATIYMLIRLLKPSRRDLAFLVETLLFTGFLLSAIGIVTYFNEENVVIAEEGTRRLTSVYGSPNSVGLFLGRILPFALAYLLVNGVSQWRKILAGVTGAVMLIALALSQSVGAILLGLPAAVVVVLLGWRGRRAIPVLVGLGAAGLLALIPLSRLLPRLRQITDFEHNTTVVRLNLWRSTFEMLKDHPLTGVGMDQFLYQYRSRYILPEAWEDPDLSHPHNVILDYWVRLGILGVALGIAFQWFFWKQALYVYRLVRNSDPLRFALVLGVMGAMADFLAHGMVDMAHFNINLSYIFAVLLALVVELGRDDHTNITDPT